MIFEFGQSIVLGGAEAEAVCLVGLLAVAAVHLYFFSVGMGLHHEDGAPLAVQADVFQPILLRSPLFIQRDELLIQPNPGLDIILIRPGQDIEGILTQEKLMGSIENLLASKIPHTEAQFVSPDLGNVFFS